MTHAKDKSRQTACANATHIRHAFYLADDRISLMTAAE